jgi:diguanylate cyclase (GGDEF)-like protein
MRLLGVHTAMQADLRQAGRREWWLWLSALLMTVLSGIVYFLSSFPALFTQGRSFVEISPDQARWAVMNLLLLFDAWLVYRQWLFRRLRTQPLEPQPITETTYSPSALDQATGFYTRASVEQRLGKEVVRAKRHKVPLSLVALHLDDVPQLSSQHDEAGKQIITEFADCLRRATRGCDFCARLGSNDFLLVLPECSMRDAKIVSDRLETATTQYAGRDNPLTYSVGWIDYNPGDVPADLLKRAADMLRLYSDASTNAVTLS